MKSGNCVLVLALPNLAGKALGLNEELVFVGVWLVEGAGHLVKLSLSPRRTKPNNLLSPRIAVLIVVSTIRPEITK